MAVNLVSSPTTTVQQQTTKAAKRGRTGNAKFPAGTVGLELKDLVAVLPDILGKTKPHRSSAICKPRTVVIPPDSGSGASGAVGGGELHLAIASLNAASKEFSTLAEKVMAIAAATNSSSHNSKETGQQDCQLINDSNNTTVNEKEKTERHIYKEIDDITLADSKAPSPVPWSAAFQSQTRPVATPTADAGNTVVAIDNPCTPARKPTSARNEVIVKDCTATVTIPRGPPLAVPPPPVLAPPPLEEKLDKLLDSVVKIKVDMHQKIDRIARRVDQIRQDVQLNIDNTDRSVCNNLLELAGVPHRKGENLQLYFRRICELLGYTEADIPLVDIRRKRADRTEKTESSISTATNPNLKGTEAADQAEPPVITIEFIFKNIRDNFYRAYLRARPTPLRLADIGLESDRRIYINESLTKLNQKLKSAALRKKRDGLLHAVYTVDGAVFVQAQPGQKGRRVCSLAELE